MIIWFTGISGTGKTTIAKFLVQKLKKKYESTYHLDGDEFRNSMKNDLGFTLKDRDLNANRIINFVKSLDKQKINVVISANLTSKKFRFANRKFFKNYFEVLMKVKPEILKRRDYKNIYLKRKNVVGNDIKFHTGTEDLIIENNLTRKHLKKSVLKILKKLVNFKIH